LTVYYFFSHLPPPPPFYTLSLHDALPIFSSIVSRFAAASRKWNGMKQLPLASRCETFASSSMTPRRELTRASSPSSRPSPAASRSEEHTSELQSLRHLVCRLLLEKKKQRF